MRSLILVPLVGLMSFTLAAFIPQSVDTTTRGMVYGHLESSGAVEQVELVQANSTHPHSARVLPNGDFYFSDLEPGEYVVLRFTTNGMWHDLAAVRASELPLQVEQSGIHYVGSWRVSGASMERAAEPASDQLLRRLRPSLRGTGWEKLIKR